MTRAAVVAALLVCASAGAEEGPHVRNHLLGRLGRFAATVARQARAYPDTFFLEGPPGCSPRLALTFDDGPDGKYTPLVLDFLAEEQIAATFFLIGDLVEGRAEVVRRIAAAGHAIGGHGLHHDDYSRVGARKALADIEAGQALVAAAGGDPTLFRPPYGALGDETLAALGRRGVRVVDWSVDSFDWDPDTGADRIAALVLDNAHDGAIVLMHSGGGNRRRTLAALRVVVPELERRGYRFVTVPAILTPDATCR